MSALARFFKQRNINVSGYDKTETPLTKELEKEGIAISYNESLDLIDKNADIVIYTPAVPLGQAHLHYYISNQYPVYKRADVLYEISKDFNTSAIAGTHGKTSVTALCSWILHYAKKEPTAFIGGIVNNFNSNVVLGKSDRLIVEADEYDRSFLKLNPNNTLITAIDYDHSDIYEDYKSLVNTFNTFASNLKNDGHLIIHNDYTDKIDAESLSYSANNAKADFNACNIKVQDGNFHFDIESVYFKIRDIRLAMPGMHNVENATAAAILAFFNGAEPEQIAEALNAFNGIKRRFEFILKNEKQTIIDDYAHHPEELNALTHAVRQLYPSKKLTLVFQPHLYTRTRDLEEGFIEALKKADHTIVTDLYPARELPIPGVSSEILVEKVGDGKVIFISKNKLIDKILELNPELLVFAGAGDLDQLLNPLLKKLGHTVNE